ncbi:hypothetical protein [Halovivax sp.]|uniref:hypothetical protein n=1 Tax=Halovivax sp. TaxID=1935978 RepID=UPI0025C13885|nr:hypothetical protein [Halovivax sp.]
MSFHDAASLDLALLDAAFVFLASLALGTLAIVVAVRLLVDRDAGVATAAITALLGAAAWAVVTGVLGAVPLLGPLAALVTWIGVVNWRYPGGWPTAVAIGGVAWLVAVAAVAVLATLGLVAPDALGVPAL